mmetsp:Transcript_24153/g.54896  ORF Transcript_24153/g.54896 Transcript_24153/m.54896 type:complete len:240 (+) Transcript_24153:85-804(+)
MYIYILQKNLQIHLHRAGGIPDGKILQNFRMQRSEMSDDLPLPQCRIGQHHHRPPSRKVRSAVGPPLPLRLGLLDNVGPPLPGHPKLPLFVVGRGHVLLLRPHLAQGHDAVHQPVHDLEPRRGSGVHRADPPDVSGSDDGVADHVLVVAQDHVGDLEELHAVGEGGGAVVLEGLQEAGEEGGADHLVFYVGGVGEGDGVGADGAEEGGVIVRQGGEAVREDLGVAGARDLVETRGFAVR